MHQITPFLHFGNLKIPKTALLAPMAGVADRAYRLLCREYHAAATICSYLKDLRHPVLGSIVPTFAMATMVVSKAIGRFFPLIGEYLWLAAVIVHLLFLGAFIVFRMRERQMQHMVPSWFIPPVGISTCSS